MGGGAQNLKVEFKIFLRCLLHKEEATKLFSVFSLPGLNVLIFETHCKSTKGPQWPSVATTRIYTDILQTDTA